MDAEPEAVIVGADARDELKRELSLFDSIYLVVACVIGAGIFFTPGRVAELIPHPHWILAAWLFGGALSLAGALANAELGAMFPRAGGNYVYLREGVHPIAGFLVGWLSFFAIMAGTIAALAAVAAQGLCDWFGFSDSWVVPGAIAITLAASLLNVPSVRSGARANNLAAIIKIGALVVFCLVGPMMGQGDIGRLVPEVLPEGISEPSLLGFGLAMSPVLFSYLGWNSSVYVASEIRNPARNLPISLFGALAICTALYLAVNCLYLYALPLSTLIGVGDAGRASALVLFGPIGGTLVGLFVLASVLGTLNATVLLGPRIAYSMALDGLFFGAAGRVNPVFRTPVVAIWVQAAVTVGILLVLRTFPSALDFTTFAILLASMADVVALYRLRRRDPERPRPYRAWGYPWIPGLYFVAIAAIVATMIWGRPLECLVGIGMLIAGLPFYFVFSKGNESPSG
ncbi:MAG: APC family permease [Deltaproteobacteria bacterium]|nr:APC family permease [Deltaproteobacteria bacterium]